MKGEFTATLRNQTWEAVGRFVVTRRTINSPPLISKSTLQELGMLQIREDGSFAKTNDLRHQEEPLGIKSVKQDKDLKPEIKKRTNQYSDVFKGIRKIRDIKNLCKVQHETRSSARSSKTETSGLLPARSIEEMKTSLMSNTE